MRVLYAQILTLCLLCDLVFCGYRVSCTTVNSIGDDVVALLMTSNSPLVRELFEASHNGSAKASESSGPAHKVSNSSLI
jgi:hypothetical protein